MTTIPRRCEIRRERHLISGKCRFHISLPWQDGFSLVSKAYLNADEALLHDSQNAERMRVDGGIMESLEARQRAVASWKCALISSKQLGTVAMESHCNTPHKSLGDSALFYRTLYLTIMTIACVIGFLVLAYTVDDPSMARRDFQLIYLTSLAVLGLTLNSIISRIRNVFLPRLL